MWTWPLTCDRDFWLLTFVVYRRGGCQTPYQISAKLSNQRRSYCDFNSWWYDLNPLSRVALRCKICSKSELCQPICSWLRPIAFLLLIRYVTSWPWPLTLWPWTFVVHWISCDPDPYQIWAKSNNVRPSYSFSKFSSPLCNAVTLPFAPWSWTLVVGRVPCDKTQYQTWMKSINPRLGYWRFTKCETTVFCRFLRFFNIIVQFRPYLWLPRDTWCISNYQG